MTTLEIVKERIAKTGMSPVMKKHKLSYILQNPETLKWAIISDIQAHELNNLYNIKTRGLSVNDDPLCLNL